MRRSVFTVMGRPASICCQWRAENPNEIMSSWLYPRRLRCSRTRWPRALKKLAWSTTPQFVLLYEQKHHEQISWSTYWFEFRIGFGVGSRPNPQSAEEPHEGPSMPKPCGDGLPGGPANSLGTGFGSNPRSPQGNGKLKDGGQNHGTTLLVTSRGSHRHTCSAEARLFDGGWSHWRPFSRATGSSDVLRFQRQQKVPLLQGMGQD
jgi:hypothetical protein